MINFDEIYSEQAEATIKEYKIRQQGHGSIGEDHE